jgi:hypothetical protein
MSAMSALPTLGRGLPLIVGNVGIAYIHRTASLDSAPACARRIDCCTAQLDCAQFVGNVGNVGIAI